MALWYDKLHAFIRVCNRLWPKEIHQKYRVMWYEFSYIDYIDSFFFFFQRDGDFAAQNSVIISWSVISLKIVQMINVENFCWFVQAKRSIRVRETAQGNLIERYCNCIKWIQFKWWEKEDFWIGTSLYTECRCCGRWI